MELSRDIWNYLNQPLICKKLCTPLRKKQFTCACRKHDEIQRAGETNLSDLTPFLSSKKSKSQSSVTEPFLVEFLTTYRPRWSVIFPLEREADAS